MAETGRARVETRPSRFAAWRMGHQRALAATLDDLQRRPLGVLLTAFVIGITLALPAGLHALLRNVDALGGGLDGSLRASLFLKDSVDTDRGEALAQTLSRRAGVSEAHYLSREQALAEFRRYSGFAEALDAVRDNPLPSVIVVTPDARAPQATVDALFKDLGDLPEVEQAKIDRQWLQRLYAIVDIARRVVFTISAVLALAVLVVIGNTIRLDIESRREEIVVLKLIGATDAFIRRPFLYAGLWYGLAGAILACVLVEIGIRSLTGPVRHLAALYDTTAQLKGLAPLAYLMVLGAGILLGVMGAAWTVSRHLHRIEPV